MLDNFRVNQILRKKTKNKLHNIRYLANMYSSVIILKNIKNTYLIVCPLHLFKLNKKYKSCSRPCSRTFIFLGVMGFFYDSVSSKIKIQSDINNIRL